jgi:REP element-mobilizing transposase RayT
MPTRKTDELHAYRWSASGVRYFVTMCTAARKTGLDAPSVRARILQTVKASDGGGDTESWAFTVMPNHLHWLFRLGGRLELGQVVGRLKAQTFAALADAGLGWQRDFFEHRLRAREGTRAYARYIFMNPFRAGLLAREASWPGWWCPQLQRMEFLTLLNPDGSVPREWLEEDGAGSPGPDVVGND